MSLSYATGTGVNDYWGGLTSLEDIRGPSYPNSYDVTYNNSTLNTSTAGTIAIGSAASSTWANTSNTVAIGYGATTLGNNSIAIGYNTTATAPNSVNLGNTCIVSADGFHVTSGKEKEDERLGIPLQNGMIQMKEAIRLLYRERYEHAKLFAKQECCLSTNLCEDVTNMMVEYL
jgi:hypothetical protein